MCINLIDGDSSKGEEVSGVIPGVEWVVEVEGIEGVEYK